MDRAGCEPVGRRGLSGPALWSRLFLALLGFATLWSLATPLGSGPDEANHLVRSWALMHGQPVGVPVEGPVSPYTRVQAPESYASTIALPLCFAFRPNVPAGCSPPISPSNRTVASTIYVGRFPPLYYAVVGWPTRFLASPVAAFYVVRLVNAVASCGLLALALCLALRARSPRFLVVGVAAALTPMVLYLSAVINPNSLEVAASLCLWTAAVVLVQEMRRAEVSASALRIVVLVALVVVLVRTPSALWVLLVAVATSPIVVRVGVPWRAVVRRWEVRAGTCAIVAAGLLSVAWTVAKQTQMGSNPPPPASTPFLSLAQDAGGQASGWVLQAIGYFGWLDAPAPLLTVLIWLAAVGCMVLCALGFARSRERLSLLLTAGIAVVVPLALVLAVVRSNGLIGLGRYFLPLFVGIPIVASIAMDPVVAALDGARRLARTVLIALSVGQVAAYLWALHRYRVGAHSSFSPFATVAGGWTSPVPPILLDAAFVLLAGLATAGLVRCLGPAAREDDHRPEPEPATPAAVAA